MMERTLLLATGAAMSAGLLLAACGRGETDTAAEHPLEFAATQRGLISGSPDAPEGIFERRRKDGRERLCVVRSGDESWRFAAQFLTEDGQSCLSRGSISLSDEDQGRPGDLQGNGGRAWKLHFAGLEGCEIDALAQGDRLILPDPVPAACLNLCAGQAQLTGAELERTSWAEQEARQLRLRGSDGLIWTDCGSEKAG